MQRQFLLALERDRLAQACEVSLAEAEKLAKSKSALLSTLSDEVRTGLAGVTHVLAAAAAGGPARSAPSREQLNAALGAAKDLVEVLDATLDSESAEDGRLTIRAEPIDAARLVRDLVLLNQPLAGAKGLELVGHVDPDAQEGAAKADPVRTRQVLANLMSNALKYTQRGRVEVRVRREGEDRLRFEVADTGPGLSKDELAGAFTPFTRIERTCAGSTGAGVGLSLCKKLASLMDGEVAADSAPGVGSCFWLDLPFEVGAEPKVAPLRSGPEARSLKVLVADDDQLTAAITRQALEELGHHVLQAQNPRRAAELLKVCDVDLMVVGFADGEVAAKAARLLRAAPNPSANAPMLGMIVDAEEAAARLAAGCNGVMQKPINTATVARAIAELEAQVQAANAA
jgi:CheY-like chemotaxis protein/nitrogen-specific signal transduction histidine kinase